MKVTQIVITKWRQPTKDGARTELEHKNRFRNLLRKDYRHWARRGMPATETRQQILCQKQTNADLRCPKVNIEKNDDSFQNLKCKLSTNRIVALFCSKRQKPQQKAAELEIGYASHRHIDLCFPTTL